MARRLPFELIPEGERYVRRNGKLHRTKKPSKRVRIVVFVRDDFTCQECGWVAERPEDDYDGSYVHNLELGHHPIPYRDGGPFHEANLRAECRPCNLRRGPR